MLSAQVGLEYLSCEIVEVVETFFETKANGCKHARQKWVFSRFLCEDNQ